MPRAQWLFTSCNEVHDVSINTKGDQDVNVAPFKGKCRGEWKPAGKRTILKHVHPNSSSNKKEHSPEKYAWVAYSANVLLSNILNQFKRWISWNRLTVICSLRSIACKGLWERIRKFRYAVALCLWGFFFFVKTIVLSTALKFMGSDHKNEWLYCLRLCIMFW